MALQSMVRGRVGGGLEIRATNIALASDSILYKGARRSRTIRAWRKLMPSFHNNGGLIHKQCNLGATSGKRPACRLFPNFPSPSVTTGLQRRPPQLTVRGRPAPPIDS